MEEKAILNLAHVRAPTVFKVVMRDPSCKLCLGLKILIRQRWWIWPWEKYNDLLRKANNSLKGHATETPRSEEAKQAPQSWNSNIGIGISKVVQIKIIIQVFVFSCLSFH